ncbi:MAG: RNA polymerase sigma-70 factor [Bacteroidia bacterium]|nr:RNA polymerase sigma-70 factor [Bacteroidia bacterium]
MEFSAKNPLYENNHFPWKGKTCRLIIQKETDYSYLKISMPPKFIHTIFETWFHSYYTSLCRAAYSVLKDSGRAEDVVQDVFLKLWDKQDELDIKSSPGGYLYRAVIHAALNALPKEQSIRSNVAEFPETETINPVNTDSEILAEELEGALLNALKLLPEGCSTVFVMSRFRQMSYTEIAAELDISPKTVENQMGKSLRLLREHLKNWL